MKKLILPLVLLLSSINASAFRFDGINLNMPYTKVATEIARRGYAYDSEHDCLRGNCQGTEIFLRLNYSDVKKKGMLGQLIVDVPMKNLGTSMEGVYMLFNVVYHQVSRTDDSITYAVDEDGTRLCVSKRDDSTVVLTYFTPYYKAN